MPCEKEDSTSLLNKLPRIQKKIRVALDWTLDLCFLKDFACVTTSHGGGARSARADRTGRSGRQAILRFQYDGLRGRGCTLDPVGPTAGWNL